MADFGYLLPTREVVLASDDGAELAARTASDVIGMARRAEAVGFDGAWVGDSVLAKPRLEPLSTLAGVGGATDGLDLGTAVYLPPLRNPVHVAHLTATVDQVSGGRFNFGIGVGIGPDVKREYANIGHEYGTRGRRMDELLEVVTGLWSGESVDYDGEFFQLADASIGFGPVSGGRIYIPTLGFDPTEGFPRAIERRLVEYGAGWLPITMPPEDYASSLADIHDLLEANGRDADLFDPAMYIDVMVDPDDEEAIEAGRAFYARYYPEWDRLSEAEIREKGAFGAPAHVAETIDAYREAGVENFVVRFAAEDQREQLARFSRAIEL